MAVVFTWPLAPHLGDAIPAGSGPPTVALFGWFSLQWSALAWSEGQPYWDAPQFYPHQGTLAWSETQPFTALLAGLATPVVGATAAYNLVLLLYLATFGLAGYALARQLTDDRIAALWASLWLIAGTFALEQLGVVHLLAGAFPVACLAAILAQARRFRWSVAWAAGLCYLLTFLTCVQFGLLLTLLMPCALLAFAPSFHARWRSLAGTLVPLLVAVVVALPGLLTQRAYLGTMGFERSLVNVTGAYLPADLALPARGHWLSGRILGWSNAPGAYPWDLGLVLLASIAVAMVLGGWRRQQIEPERRSLVIALVALSSLALALGFGPHLAIDLGGVTIAPYAWLHGIVPGLGGVRTPARFGLFAVVGIVALGAVSLAFLRRRAATPRGRRALTAIAFGLLAAEMWTLPIALTDPTRGVDDRREALDWLARHGDRQPIVDLPMSAGDSEAELERETRAMLRALVHRSPIANGYSGYLPEPFRQLRQALAQDPAGRGRRFLDAVGIRLALADRAAYTPAQQRALVRDLAADIVLATAHDLVLRLPPGTEPRPLPPPISTPRFDTLPRSGDILRLSVAADARRARLFAAAPGQILQVAWSDLAGLPHTKRVRLGGTLLIDAASTRLYVLLHRFPAGDRDGTGVLISRQRVAEGRPGER